MICPTCGEDQWFCEHSSYAARRPGFWWSLFTIGLTVALLVVASCSS